MYIEKNIIMHTLLCYVSKLEYSENKHTGRKTARCVY